MFKYLDDKNNIINSYSGIRSKYEIFKFNIEKKNLIHNFITTNGITHDVILDFIKMMQSYSIDNSGTCNSVIDFGDGEYIKYNIIPMSNNKVLLSIESYKNDNSIILINVGICNTSNDNTIIIKDNKYGINYNYTLSGVYNDDVNEYINILKRYMLYMLEYTLIGGLKNEKIN